MKTYRMNAVMGGVLYILGTVFGVVGGIIGGEVLVSLIAGQPLAGVDMLSLVAAHSSQITAGAFFTFMMGISLTAMTIFLYPILRKDSEELALGMVLFRGALEGTSFYFGARLSDHDCTGQRVRFSRGQFSCFAVYGHGLVSVSGPQRPARYYRVSHGGHVSLSLLLPHSVDPPLVDRLGTDRRSPQSG